MTGRSIRTGAKLLASALLLAAAPARAADDVAQVWYATLATGPIAGKTLIWLEGQARIGEAPQRQRQFILRPAIGRQIGRTTQIHAGYAYVPTGTAARLRDEHRFWQQIAFRIVRTDRIQLLGRSRIEQRLFSGEDMSWRLRQQIRANLPLGGKDGVSLVLWSEGFFNLNAPAPRFRTGIDRWRNQIGLNIPVTRSISFEPGYLNQYVRRRGEDAMDHIFWSQLVIRL
ncbi:DUF2490 domain-containing protein [Sphingomonas changnyeongensis]|uniref:DUF2490 domain-containing protein n=1 Tax=Sphingomonas changnyeongensis TaxID=2698679 RepID=A0A7Z2NWE9_9SPHN|nr:DUF2490 domain-containing protein [Sphingomonas changnyeongensis]QHL91088.1 DUF2490 domain-containing protein [Sphingomonas changnyeongensis]